MKRVLTALLLMPLVVGLVFWGPGLAVRGALALAACLCLREFFVLARQWGARPFRVLGYSAAVVVVFAPETFAFEFLVALAVAALTAGVLRAGPLENVPVSAAATLFGIVYIAGAFSLGGGLHRIGASWLFLALAMNWIGDSAAYYAGRAWGRRALAPRVSPKKTWEGAAASFVTSVAFALAYLHWGRPEPPLNPWEAFSLAAVINISAQFGDLAESALKRGAGLKDSGGLLPGHGGLLDRVDGLLFSLPAAYLTLGRVL